MVNIEDVILECYSSLNIKKELMFSKEDDVVWICSTDEEDGTQHDYELNKKDWELIKKVVDNFFETC